VFERLRRKWLNVFLIRHFNNDKNEPMITCAHCGREATGWTSWAQKVNQYYSYDNEIFYACSRKCLAEKRKSDKIEQEAAEREAEERASVDGIAPILSLLDSGQIAIRVAEEISLEELAPVILILKNEQQIEQLLRDANEKLTDQYTREIIAKYKELKVEFPSHRIQDSKLPQSFFNHQLNADLGRCVDFGVIALRKNAVSKGLLSDASDSASSDDISSRKIEKTKSWKEIQKES